MVFKISFDDFVNIVKERGLKVFYFYDEQTGIYSCYAYDGITFQTDIFLVDFKMLQSLQDNGEIKLIQLISKP